MTNPPELTAREEFERWHTHESLVAGRKLEEALALEASHPDSDLAKDLAYAARAWREELLKVQPSAWPEKFDAKDRSLAQYCAKKAGDARIAYVVADTAWMRGPAAARRITDRLDATEENQ